LTETTASPVVNEEAPDHSARNRLAITVLLIASFVVILNETTMGVAIPVIRDAFGVDNAAAQWLTTAFMLTMGVVIPITGFLIQRFNTRPIFLTAIGLFSVGTLVAALAPAFPVLIAARVIQASGTAIMMPLLFTTVLTLVAENHRGRVMGNISIVISVAPALGPLVSGLILQAFVWEFTFWLMLPIALIVMTIGYFKVPNVTEPRKTPLDVFSIFLSAIGFGGFVYGISNIGTLGIAAVASWLPLTIGTVVLTFFVLRQLSLQKRDAALLDLRTFKHRTFAVTIIIMTVAMMGMFGAITLLPLFMQGVLELTTAVSGLILLPGGLLMGLAAPFVGRLYDRIGPRPLVISGTIIVSAGLWGLTLLNAGSTVLTVTLTYLLLCLGFALMFTPLFTSGLGDIPPKLYSHGSAVVGTVQQVAGASGVAILFTIMTAVALQLGDTNANEASPGGLHAAFLGAAIISLVTIPLSFFVRKPVGNGAGAGH
jgi:MFS transporter, DHA2 family, lincomycin resistance protein